MEHNKSNQRGFALILSMVMLLAMTLMGSVLLMNASLTFAMATSVLINSFVARENGRRSCKSRENEFLVIGYIADV